MMLGGLDRRSRLSALDGGTQGLPEQRERPEALDPPETGLDVQQGGGASVSDSRRHAADSDVSPGHSVMACWARVIPVSRS